MAEVRAGIDRLDRQIMALLGERFRYVEAAARIKREDGTTRDVRARVVVDASGQNGLISNRLRLRVWDPLLN